MIVFWLDWLQVTILAVISIGGTVLLFTQGRCVLATIQELQEAVAALKAEVAEEVAHINALADKIDELLANQGDPEAIAAVVADIRAATAALDTAAAENPVPGTEPPPPPEG